MFQALEQAGRRLRRVGDGGDGDRLADGVLRDLAVLGLGICQDGGADRAAGADRAGVPHRQSAQDPGRRLVPAGHRRDDGHDHADVGRAARKVLVQGDAKERGRARLAGAQARAQAAASRAGHGAVPDRRSELGADLADAQPQAQPRAARAQHHHDDQDRGYAARCASRAHHSGAGFRHLHPRHRALRLHGDAERAEDPRALPAQGSQHRDLADVVLPVAAIAQDNGSLGDAALAGACCSSRSPAPRRTPRPTSRSRPTASSRSARRWACEVAPIRLDPSLSLRHRRATI